MVRTLLVRGMLVGVVAGLLSFGFLKIYGEPQVDRAIAFETQMDEAKAAAEKAEGRTKACTWLTMESPNSSAARCRPALACSPPSSSTARRFGGLFGLAFAFAYGRLPGAPTPQASSALLAAMGFIAIYLVPNLKYPANPPSVGDPETIGYAHSALFHHDRDFARAPWSGRPRSNALFVARVSGEWNANLIAAACYIAVVVFAVAPASGGQRSAGRVSGRRAVEIPHCIARERNSSCGRRLACCFGALTQRTLASGSLRA